MMRLFSAARANRASRPTRGLSSNKLFRGTLGLAAGLCWWWTGTAEALVYQNTASNVIPNSALLLGPAASYPAPITVSGEGSILTGITVTFTNLSHAYPDDLDILLVGPGGQNVMLMSDCGGYFPINNLTLTFSDAATGLLPDETQIVGGTYKPTNYDANFMTDSFAAPAPVMGPYGSLLSLFNGTNPNGVWSLYIIDDTQGNAGVMAGGWSLNITSVPEPSTFALGALALAGIGAAYARRRACRPA